MFCSVYAFILCEKNSHNLDKLKSDYQQTNYPNPVLRYTIDCLQELYCEYRDSPKKSDPSRIKYNIAKQRYESLFSRLHTEASIFPEDDFISSYLNNSHFYRVYKAITQNIFDYNNDWDLY